VSSGEYAARLLRRARGMLDAARWHLGRGFYDLACFEAEQAAQLALKHVLYFLEGSAPRIHSLSELLGLLYRFLARAGLEDVAQRVADFTAGSRHRLWVLEDAYYQARYGHIEYGEEDARQCIELAEAIIRLVEEVKKAAAPEP